MITDSRSPGGVARPSFGYARRDPGGSVLYRIVRDHFETFRADAARLRAGDGLPRFVEAEFRAFLFLQYCDCPRCRGADVALRDWIETCGYS